MMDPKNHAFLPILLLFLLLSTPELAASQQNSSQPDQPDPYGYNGSLSPAMAVVVIIVVAALFFMGFFTVYIRHCTRAVDGGSVYTTGVARRRDSNETVARGLDATTIESFPTFVYAEVKTQKIGKGALECAICLNEFVDDETLRLLPKCDHLFHPHCIGEWLQGHVTCPVCRTNLSVPQQQLVEPVRPEEVTETNLEAAIPEPVAEVTSVKFSRSHTTGHSVVLPGENTDRFTLKLPKELRKKIMADWKSNRSNSVFVLPRGGSLSSGKSVEPSRAKSDRWLFLKTPSLLWRNRDDGSVKLGGTSSVRGNVINSPTGDSVRADRWAFLRNPSFSWRTTPVPSPRGEGTSSVQEIRSSGSVNGLVRLPV